MLKVLCSESSLNEPKKRFMEILGISKNVHFLRGLPETVYDVRITHNDLTGFYSISYATMEKPLREYRVKFSFKFHHCFLLEYMPPKTKRTKRS